MTTPRGNSELAALHDATLRIEEEMRAEYADSKWLAGATSALMRVRLEIAAAQERQA